MKLIPLLAFWSVCFECVTCPSVAGVAEVTRRYCCGDSKPAVAVDNRCENRFLVDDLVVGLVKGPRVQFVPDLVRFHENNKTMEFLDCLSFSHWTFCELDETFVLEKVCHFEPALDCNAVSGSTLTSDL